MSRATGWGVLAALLFAGGAAVAYGWRAVSSLAFHAGLLLCAAGLGLLSALAARRGWSSGVFALNTAVCLLVGSVLVEPVLRAVDRTRTGVPATHSFQEAGGRPEAFVRWHEEVLAENRRHPGNLIPDPRGQNAPILAPGREGRFMESRWWINSLGFRGPEISRDKGRHYRIVALGESTTFGSTRRADDRPWPEVLEAAIASEFECRSPIQVINAGVPGWTLANQLARLRSDIFPLEPDVILSYHGFNGFPYLLKQIPTVNVGKAPWVPPRPSRLLERLESTIRIGWFRRRYRAARAIDASVLHMDVGDTRYADLYRQLVEMARQQRVALVLATFAMAVTPESPEAVIRFYEPVFPDLRARILANRLHTLLVENIAKQYGVRLVDTSPGLDGAYLDAFVDPIHMTQIGSDRLAAHMLEGLRALLAAPSPGCRPRTGESTTSDAPVG
jgi:hypothetical protein